LNSLLDFSWASSPNAWIGLVTLVALEIVLGIDNIVFISILSAKLPPEQQPRARRLGLILAVLPRILLLLFLPLVLSLEKPLFFLPFPDPHPHVDPAHPLPPGAPKPNLGISGQDLIILIGGIFLLYKATHEIHEKLEGEEHGPDGNGEGDKDAGKGKPTMGTILVQIMLLNIVFSLDSIITAIGMVPKDQVMVMVIAVLVSTAVMAFSVNVVSAFVEKHPTVKMLALSFLLLIGFTLVAEAFHVEIPKGYVYFAMGFSVAVEALNLLAKRRSEKAKAPVQLRGPHLSSVNPQKSGEETGQA
jgi:predicted tellurium resistance membrane protein TerC